MWSTYQRSCPRSKVIMPYKVKIMLKILFSPICMASCTLILVTINANGHTHILWITYGQICKAHNPHMSKGAHGPIFTSCNIYLTHHLKKNQDLKFHDLRRLFSRSIWPWRSNLRLYLESSHQVTSYRMVKFLKKTFWKIAPFSNFWAAHISKTVRATKFFEDSICMPWDKVSTHKISD